MPNNFEILAGFLARYGAEVEGRENAPLPTDVADQLRRFALGQLAGPLQSAIIQQLGQHPDWIAFLATEVKALRNPGLQQPG